MSEVYLFLDGLVILSGNFVELYQDHRDGLQMGYNSPLVNSESCVTYLYHIIVTW